MPSVRVANTLAANATVANVLAGSPFEFVGSLSSVEVAMSRDVITAASVLLADVTFGPEVQIEGANIGVEVAVGQGPRLPDMVIVSDVAAPGDRIRVAIRETSGTVGNNIVVTFVRIEPLA